MLVHWWISEADRRLSIALDPHPSLHTAGMLNLPEQRHAFHESDQAVLERASDPTT
jgi:hypothetical protein